MRAVLFMVFALFAVLVTASPVDAATVTVAYISPGDGFDDPGAPDPASPAPGATIGDQRKASFEAAATAWGAKLTSNVTIVIEAQMTPLTCNAFSAVLGSAGTTFIFRNNAAFPLANTWYHSALADKLANVELNPGPGDVGATFNSSIDNNNACLNGTNWIYDTVYQAPPVANTISFYDVVLHEIGHGVGVSTFVNNATGARFLNTNDIYMTFLEDHNLAGGRFWNSALMSNNQRRLSAIDTPNTHFRGPAVQAVVDGGLVLAGGVNNGHAMVYAPNPLEPGSSVSHWDTSVVDLGGTSEIMEPFSVPGADFLITDQLLEDLGWGPVTTVPVTLSSFEAMASGSGVRIHWSTATEVGNAGFNLYAQVEGEWQRLNQTLIPSDPGDSLETRNYQFLVQNLEAEQFRIEDVDQTHRKRSFGEFLLDQRYGRPPAPLRIDWQSIREEHLTAVAGRSGRVPGSIVALDVLVEQDGLYRLTFQALADAGLDLSGVAASQVALTRAGIPIPRHINGGPTMAPGSTIDFYGEGIESQYTRTNVYRITVDNLSALPGRVDTELPDSPDDFAFERAHRRIDDNLAYSFASPNGDPWYLQALLSFGTPVSANWIFTPDRLRPGPASVHIEGWSVTDFIDIEPDHHIVARLDGEVVLDLWQDGLQPFEQTIDFTAEPSTQIDVELELPGDAAVPFDLIHMESIALEYRRELVATDGYYEFEMASEGGPAAYPLDNDGIFAVGFESAITTAIAIREVPGDNPMVYSVGEDGLTRYLGHQVTVEANGHRVDVPARGPNHRFIVADESNLMAPRLAPSRPPADLLSQPADYLIIAHPDFLAGIQPLAQHHRNRGLDVHVTDLEDIYAAYSDGIVDPQAIREYVRDLAAAWPLRFVLLVGGDTYDYLDYLGVGSVSFVPTLYSPTHPVVAFTPSDPLFADIDGDNVPDLALGRLPVRSGQDLDQLVDKILTYAAANHEKTAVFVADEADAEADYGDLSDLRLGQMPGSWQVDRAYIDDLGITSARQVLLDTLNGGVTLAHYFGHSGPNQWAFSGLFDGDDARQLTNSGQAGIIVQWGCWNSWYVDPLNQTLADALLLSGDHGAAAVLGAATLTQVTSDNLLGGLLIPRMTIPGATLGEALLESKQELAQTRPDLLDVILGWTLLGDPAQQLDPQ